MRETISVPAYREQIFHLFDKQWLLLTSGDFQTKQFNMMTISWGSMGIIWHKPFVMVLVRPTRYTYDFMEKYPTFTLTAFANDYKKVLQQMGTVSGRNMDKISNSGLTPEASAIVGAPTFKEAMLSIECKKIYADNLKPEFFLDSAIEKNYPEKDYHRFYFGEIVHLEAEKEKLFGMI
ncbi:MAG: flavin reductase [Calditrichia bacterium]